jgi:hypothetical protein
MKSKSTPKTTKPSTQARDIKPRKNPTGGATSLTTKKTAL